MTVAQCVSLAAKLFRVSSGAITGECRDAKCVKPRFAVIWVAREKYGYSFSRIGAALGDRDHTSIMNGYKRAQQWRAEDKIFRKRTDTLSTMKVGTVSACPCCGRRFRKAVA